MNGIFSTVFSFTNVNAYYSGTVILNSNQHPHTHVHITYTIHTYPHTIHRYHTHTHIPPDTTDQHTHNYFSSHHLLEDCVKDSIQNT